VRLCGLSALGQQTHAGNKIDADDGLLGNFPARASVSAGDYTNSSGMWSDDGKRFKQ
jgi:hypothetical protein